MNLDSWDESITPLFKSVSYWYPFVFLYATFKKYFVSRFKEDYVFNEMLILSWCSTIHFRYNFKKLPQALESDTEYIDILLNDVSK